MIINIFLLLVLVSTTWSYPGTIEGDSQIPESRFDEMDKIKINISSIWDEVNRLSQWISSHDKVDHHHHHYNDDQQNHHNNDTLEMDDHSNHTHKIGHHHNDNNLHQGEHSHDEHMRSHHHHDDSHEHEHAHHSHRQSHDDHTHDDDNSDEEKSSGNPLNYGKHHHHHHQHGSKSHCRHCKHSKNGHRHNHHHNKIGDRSDENDSDEKHGQNRSGLTFKTAGIGEHKFDLNRQYDENKIFVVGFCDMKPNRELPESNIRGNISVLQRKYGKGPIYYKIKLEGFKGGMSKTSRTHGFHIHEKAIDEGLCNSAGDHFNPENQAHGSLTSIERHLGDFGNIIVDGYGKLTEYELIDHWNNISNIFGKSFVVHELPDDLGKGGNPTSLANGNAGKRLACCTIHSGTEESIRFNG